LRAGVIGAGELCAVHAAAVRAVPDVELVGVVEVAGKLAVETLASLDELVDAGADVIHVLTPPSSRGEVALAALERGCHVLVEPPVSSVPEEGRRVAALARQKGLTATVVHALLYDPQVARALATVGSGVLGQVVSVDVQLGSAYPPYEGGPLPAHYRDAGYPFRDLGLHCLYLLQALLGSIEDVDASWRSLGGDPDLAHDEWRATVRCQRGLGQLHLTWNPKPMPSRIIIRGTRAAHRVDLFAMSTSLPRAAERILGAFTQSIQSLVDVPAAMWRFVHKEIPSEQGRRNLVADVYRRLAAGEPPPVAMDDAIDVGVWVEKVARAAEAEHGARLARFTRSDTVPFLVTGAAGSLGGATVRRLVADGQRVRALVRRLPEQPLPGVEYALGNLGDPAAVDRAVKGAETVIHAGAATRGGWPAHLVGTVIGTQNVIDACTRHGVAQLVHISSMSVIDWAGSAGNGATVDESAALEPRPDERGAYTRAKLEAEQRVSAAAAAGLPAVILRPGQIFGGGIQLLNGAVARRAGGRWLVLGDGQLELPLVYIDDVVDAIMASIERELNQGEIIQIIDGEALTQRDVLDLAGGGVPTIRVPRALVFGLSKLSEYPLGALGRPSPVALYRLKSALARLHWGAGKAEKLLGWRPRVGVREGIRRELAER
jgi:nucleoside-diphosphate-sugar epimerase/predicted dehydrogenase